MYDVENAKYISLLYPLADLEYYRFNHPKYFSQEVDTLLKGFKEQYNKFENYKIRTEEKSMAAIIEEVKDQGANADIEAMKNAMNRSGATKNDKLIPIIIASAIALAAVIAISVLLIVNHKRKKNAEATPEVPVEPVTPVEPGQPVEQTPVEPTPAAETPVEPVTPVEPAPVTEVPAEPTAPEESAPAVDAFNAQPVATETVPAEAVPTEPEIEKENE